ncbi:MAG: HAD family hydrolase [Bacteriovoracaceae bacterium]|nr:HAD family hydrolase [Bacteriovoracaceae bacterium]
MVNNFNKIDLFIFDMDGTLVESHLDFDKMRLELGFPKGEPILEYIEKLDSIKEKEEAFKIVNEHELKGAQVATPMPGIESLFSKINSLGKQKAILTRNSKLVTDFIISKFDWEFDSIVTRDCITAQKPEPEGLHKICNELKIPESNSCYIGDYRFDLEAATNAKMLGLFYSTKGLRGFEELADFVYKDHKELAKVLK